jgi:hypothetical protein
VAGEAHVRFTIEAVRAIMQATPDEDDVAGRITPLGQSGFMTLQQQMKQRLKEGKSDD